MLDTIERSLEDYTFSEAVDLIKEEEEKYNSINKNDILLCNKISLINSSINKKEIE